MLKTLLNYFKTQMGDGTTYDTPSQELTDKYKNVFITDKDEFEIITEIWSTNGFCGYKNGLFWLVNPDIFTELARKFPSVSDTSIAFARSAMGGLFLFDKKEIGDSIIYLNPHLNTTKIISTSFQVFIPMDMPADTFWKRECYGKFELKAIEKHGPLEHDECYTFTPALALGGNESISNLQKVKLIENLEMLSELY